MQRRMMTVAMWLLLVLIVGKPLGAAEPETSESLSSWNDGASKKVYSRLCRRA